MKVHAVIISFLLFFSFFPKAEEASLWNDFLSFFSSGDNQGNPCDDEDISEELAEELRANVCPQFLMKQMIERDQKTMMISSQSPEKNCLSDISRYTGFRFNTSQDFENYVKSKKPFSEINTAPIADCLSHPVDMAYHGGKVSRVNKETLPEDKQKVLIAEYYQTQERLESGMRGTLQDIAAIDQLIGNSNLNTINCKKFQLTPNILNECESLQKCSSSEDNLSQSAKDTIEVLRAIKAIDRQIKNLKGPRAKNANKNKDQIQELKERKASLQSLYPWTVGKIFQDGYEEDSSEEQVAQLIKDQLSYTRTRLEKNINEMQGAVSCIRNNRGCRGLNFDKVMAKTPSLDINNVFNTDQIDRMSRNRTEMDSLSSDQKEEFKKNQFTLTQFDTVQCLQKVREDVSEVRTELGFLVLDVGLTVATVGLGSAAIAGRLSIRAGGHISKAQRLQNLGLMGVDISFSAPYINRAIDDCDSYMNQLERTASEETNNICEKLPVRSQLTSDLKSCLLTASLASLPLAVPAFAVAGRAVFKAVQKRTPPARPDPPPTSSQAATRQSADSADSGNSQATLPKPDAEATAAARTERTPPGTDVVVRESPSPRVVSRTNDSPSPLKLLSAPNPRRAAPPVRQQSTGSARSSGASQRNRAAARDRSQAGASQRNRAAVRDRSQARASQRNRDAARGGRPQARSSNRGNQKFGSLKDSENRATGLIKRISSLIRRDGIDKSKSGKNHIGGYLHQTRVHLKQQNPGMNDEQISQIIAQELKQQGLDVDYAKGIFKVKNNEGVFVIDSSGELKKIGENLRSPIVAGRTEAQNSSATTVRQGTALLRSNNPTPQPNRVRGQPTQNLQQITSTTARTARSVNPSPRSVARNINIGTAGRAIGQTLLGGGAASAAGTAAASTNNAPEEDSNSSAGGSNNNDESRTRDEDRDSDDDEDRDDDEEKKKDLDCSKYQGGSPQNRRERVCYYYMRAMQLREETQNIQKNTQALNNFKNQVWLGIRENQVPPNFFTNIQKHIQQNKNVTANYLTDFGLMYNISRIQDRYLNPNERNRLRQIIQETGQYMNDPNLDGYSHIQESINLLMKRLQIPSGNPFIRI